MVCVGRGGEGRLSRLQLCTSVPSLGPAHSGSWYRLCQMNQQLLGWLLRRTGGSVLNTVGTGGGGGNQSHLGEWVPGVRTLKSSPGELLVSGKASRVMQGLGRQGWGASGPGGGWEGCAQRLRGDLVREAEPPWTTPLCTPGYLEQLPPIPAKEEASILAPSLRLCQLNILTARTVPPGPHRPPVPHPRLLPLSSCWLLACLSCRQVSLGPGFRWGLSSEEAGGSSQSWYSIWQWGQPRPPALGRGALRALRGPRWASSPGVPG